MKTLIRITIITILTSLIIFNAKSSSHYNDEIHYRLKGSDESLDPRVRLLYMDSLISLQKNPSDTILVKYAEIAYSYGNYKKALENARIILEKKSLPVNRRCWALFMMGKSQIKCGDMVNAFDTFNEILDTGKPDSLLYHDVNSLTIMSVLFSETNAHQQGSRQTNTSPYLARAEGILEYSVKKGLDSELINKMRKAIIFTKMTNAVDCKEYDSAMRYCSEMLRFRLSKIERLAIEGNMAMIFHLTGDFAKSSEYYEKVLSEPSWHINHAVCLSNYMKILNQRGEYEKVINMFNSHSDIVNMVENQHYYDIITIEKAVALSHTGRYKEANTAFMEAVQVSDSINNVQKHETIVKLTESAEMKRMLTDTEKKVSSYRIIIIALGILCLFILTVMLTLYVKWRRSRVSADAPTPTHTEDKASGFAGDKENEAVRALHLAALNEAIARISATIDDSSINEQEKLLHINALIKEIASYDDLWEIFYIQFEKLHPSFFRRIKESYPDITQGETRMCAYVMLNMSNKEIAALTRRSIRSVETMRYRLTKKMHLAPGETLSMRLAQISDKS